MLINSKYFVVKAEVIKANLCTLFEESFLSALNEQEKDLLAYIIAICNRDDNLDKKIDLALEVLETFKKRGKLWDYRATG